MKKKLIAPLATTSVMALLLTACGGDSGGDSTVADDCTPAHEGIQTLEEGVLKVAAPVTPPYLTKSGNEFSGVDGEIIKEIAANECLEIQWEEVQYGAGLQSLQSGRLDTFVGGLYRTDEREGLMAMGETVYRDGMNLLSAEGYSSLEDLEGATVGVIQGYLWNADLVAELGDGNVKQFQTSDALFNDLKAGRIDVAVLTTAEAGHRLAEDPDLGMESVLFEPNEKVAASVDPGQVTFPVESDNDSLRQAIDDNITELTESGRVAEILEEFDMDPTLAGQG